MRMFRLVAAVTALVLAASLSALVSSSATAAAPSSKHLAASAAKSAAAPAAKAARAPHKMKTVRAKEIGRNKFAAFGKIKTLRLKNVILQKAKSRNAPFKRFKVARTNGQGKFRIPFTGKIGNCFRVVAPPTPRAKTNSKVVGCIVPGS